MSKNLENLKWDIDWNIERSIRYHDRQQGFFGTCHKLVMLVATLGGGYYSIVGFATNIWDGAPLWLKVVPAITIIFLGMLDVVYGFASREALHFSLKQRFIRVKQQLLSLDNASEPDFNRIQIEINGIEVDEPPVLQVLNTLCHNELLRAKGYDWDQQINVGWLQRLLANICDYQEQRLHSKS